MKKMSKKKILVILLLIFTILCIALMFYFSTSKRHEFDEIKIKEKIVLEVGNETPEIDDFISSNKVIDKNVKIKYENVDESLKNRNISENTIYLNLNGEEVTKEEAIKNDGSLNNGYKEKKIITSIGTYNIEIIIDKKIYSSKLVIQDTIAPKLILKDVQIEEGNNLSITDFVESCKDNSRLECKYDFVKEKTDNNLEYETLEKIDTNIGERDILIRAKDSSGNQVIEKAKLKVNAKLKSTNNSINSNNYSSINENSNENNPLIGVWQYVNGQDITTYTFKEDGTLWINGEYVDKYKSNSAICDNCLTHVGLHEIQFMLKDGLLYINFYKQTDEQLSHQTEEIQSVVHYVITLDSYVKAKKIG